MLSRLIVSMALSVVLTIAVAWVCILWAPPIGPGQSMRTIDPDHPTAQSISRFGAFDSFVLFEHWGIGWEVEHVIAARRRLSRSSPSNDNKLTIATAGWPLRCLSGERRTINGRRHDWRAFSIPAFVPGADNVRRSVMPLSPQWPVLILNSLFYLATLLGIALLCTMVKRFIRRRRGCCCHCGYQLRGHSSNAGQMSCPECGMSVRSPPNPS